MLRTSTNQDSFQRYAENAGDSNQERLLTELKLEAQEICYTSLNLLADDSGISWNIIVLCLENQALFDCNFD